MTSTGDLRFERLRAAALAANSFSCDSTERAVLFTSWSDGAARATTRHAAGADAKAAWQALSKQLPGDIGAARMLRLDWIVAADRSDWGTLGPRLARTKRNYFRLGIALDSGFDHAFLETELNANAMLYGGNREPTARLNERNFAIYARRRYAIETLDFGNTTPVWTFATQGIFIDEAGDVHPLEPSGRNGGRRRVDTLDAPRLYDLVDRGSRYLATQVGPDGRFVYGWHPCFDRPIGTYNSLRHASTVYAMLEAWEVTRDAALKTAIDRALICLVGDLIVPAVLDDGTCAAFLIDEGQEIKLGGNAVAILALAKHADLCGGCAGHALLKALGAGMLHMQDKATGGFVHVLHHPSLAVKQPFRIIYYDGEAAFALTRLHALTAEARWLDAAERAFDHFEAADHASAHDHWLAYAAEALARVRPGARYVRFGIDNVQGYCDFIENRITTFPTLLELATATERLLAPIASDPARVHLLAGFDLDGFYRAMHARARYLLNGHFWPELAMFFANPARIEGSFFIRHHGFRVRIDDVEHYLSGLIAYRRYLIERRAPSPERGWTADNVAQASGGHWTVPPPEGWSTTGLCFFRPAFTPGNMVVVRHDSGGRGVPAARVPEGAAAIITSRCDAERRHGLPVLTVDDSDAAILALASYARAHLTGKVIGVTGSAGKTTMVAMLAAALAPLGTTAQTRHNANLPHGIAWNLASIPFDTGHLVLEMAIGRMRQNTMLVRPDVAVFTNILPAHLEYHRDLATIARRKSVIFDGMRPGAEVILNRDMAEWSRVRDAAQVRGLRISSYGTHHDADFRLAHRCAASGEIIVRADGQEWRYVPGARGAHMALNSVATIATLVALGHDADPGIAAVEAFSPLAGRGAEHKLDLGGGRRITLIDDAYNANPGSMQVALAQLAERVGGRRVAVLGHMAELGPASETHHAALAPALKTLRIDQFYGSGAMIAALKGSLPPAMAGTFTDTPDALMEPLLATLRSGDIVLIKGSHSSGMHRLATALITHAQAFPREPVKLAPVLSPLPATQPKALS